MRFGVGLFLTTIVSTHGADAPVVAESRPRRLGRSLKDLDLDKGK